MRVFGEAAAVFFAHGNTVATVALNRRYTCVSNDFHAMSPPRG